MRRIGFKEQRIIGNTVYVNGMKATKAGLTVTEKDVIEVSGSSEFVSRGGHKLKKAMNSFGVQIQPSRI